MLEFRLTEIEKKIMAIGQIREDLDNIISLVNKVELEIKTVKKDHGKLEANVCKLGDVFDLVKESVDSNTKKIAEFRSEMCELRQGNSQRDHQVNINLESL